MLKLALRVPLLTATLIAASLVFADELIVTALILTTIVLAVVDLVLGKGRAEEQADVAPRDAPEDREWSVTVQPGQGIPR